MSLSHETQHQNKHIELELGRPNSTFAVRVTLDLSGAAGDDVDGLGVRRGAVVLCHCLVNDGGGRGLRCGRARLSGVGSGSEWDGGCGFGCWRLRVGVVVGAIMSVGYCHVSPQAQTRVSQDAGWLDGGY